MKRILCAGVAAGVVLAGVVTAPAGATIVAAGPQAVYDATVTPLPPNLPSLGYQATQTAEFGNAVTLAGTTRVLKAATVTFSDWAKHSNWLSYPDAGFQWPITLNVYRVNGTIGAPLVGALIGTVTNDVTVPWRPETSASCGGDDAWSPDNSTDCYHGLAFNHTFDLSSLGAVPDQVIVTVAYNTQSWGANPTQADGPYDSLNVALRDTSVNGPVPVGTDTNTDDVFWDTETAANYADGGTGGVGTLREDTSWTPYTPAISLTATTAGCQFSQTGTTLTLLGDCTTDQTIAVPGGYTLDGAGHMITAVDPVGGHFLGAVVQATGPGATTVTDLRITASNLSDTCDAAPNGLRGILFDGVGGTISDNIITDIEQGPGGASGCQEGNGIEVRNTADVPMPNVTISNNTVADYQKTGILVRDNVAAVISGNTVSGDGPIDYIAQNGVQISYGATVQLLSNAVTDNWYAPKSYVACGLIMYKAGGVSGAKNGVSSLTSQFTGNENDICNYGKGGSYSPLG